MVEWLQIFVEISPWMAFFFLGIGVPWALALLPRQDWQDAAMVLGFGLALGPLFGTTYLFLLGSFAQFSRFSVVAGLIALAGIGAALAWQRRPPIPSSPPPQKSLLPALRTTLFILILIGILANIWDTAFWPFLRYDTLWTFGYNPRVFMLEGQIPDSIDYYPQLLPLTFYFGQLMHGDISDYAARTAVPWFFLGSVVSTYLLGWRLYGQRLVGWISAGLWVLTPSILVWSSSGDLEHVMPIYFSLAALAFVLAWQSDDTGTLTDSRRYALLAALMLGGAMWTKPTAGAFVFGMGLLGIYIIVQGLRQKDWAWSWRKMRLLIAVGLMAVPIGGMWYIRNILVGHEWTNLPADYWQDSAQRSGMQLNWLWFLWFLATLFLMHHFLAKANWLRAMGNAVAFILGSIAILPTMLSLPPDGLSYALLWDTLNGFREAERAFSGLESVLLLAGLALFLWSAWPRWKMLEQPFKQSFALSWALGLPFFLVYFWSFSYHYRLALTVVPLIFAPIAALLYSNFSSLLQANRLRQGASIIIVVFIALPAPIAATYHTALNTFNDLGVESDFDKYRYANPSLMALVRSLEDYAAQEGRDSLRVLAPGENRLNFYFPTWEIDDKTLPVDIEDLAGYDVFVKFVADFLWRENNLYPNQVQTWTQIAWIYPLGHSDQWFASDGPQDTAIPRVLRPIATPIDDGNYRYEIFAIDSDAAYVYIEPESPTSNVVLGEALQLLGHNLPPVMQRGQTYTLKFYWRGTAAAPLTGDYSIFVHFLQPNTEPRSADDILAQADGGLLNGQFLTRFLTPDMIVQDRRSFTVPIDLQPGQVEVRIGVYDPQSFIRLGLSVDGTVKGDSFSLGNIVIIE